MTVAEMIEALADLPLDGEIVYYGSHGADVFLEVSYTDENGAQKEVPLIGVD